ncbi:MAG: MBL fold metallo-hydrolase [Anaerolineaceae bacterium]|nr:MBL fold metallo-hydrolase [Anaerolineaceae bacterium]
MKLHILGAAQTVTGSQYLLEVNGSRLLLECGLFQGRRADTYERNRTFHYDPQKLDAVILSHAHIDHSGNLPNLVKNHYTGPIYATAGTVDLADVMLRDSGYIQESDAEYLNKKRKRKGLPAVEPLYTAADAERVKPLMVEIDYDHVFEPVPGVSVRLVEAGHILGSAAISLKIQENGKTKRLWFSGDIGRPGMPLLRDPQLPGEVDVLMMECTYGDKPHPDPEAAFQEFRDMVMRTVTRGGRVIIPAFAVGRTQELVYLLHEMNDDGLIRNIPIFVDSPLAVAASLVFKKHTEYFDEETRRLVMESRHPALDFDQLTYITDVADSKALNTRKGPMVIISASGMAEVGRILHHLKNNIEDARNTVAIVGWQAPYTLGRRLADREERVRIFDEEYDVKAEVVTIGGLSAHAGQDLLVRYAQAAQPTNRLILVHGEPDAEIALVDKLKDSITATINYPALGDMIEL